MNFSFFGDVNFLAGGLSGFLLSALGAAFIAIVKSRSFVNYFEDTFVNRAPKKISYENVEKINKFLENSEIIIHGLIPKQPKLSFKECKTDRFDFDLEKQRNFAMQQAADKYPDDPHIYISNYNKTNLATLNTLSVKLADNYSQLKAMSKEDKKSILVIGSNSLLINQEDNSFIFQKRAPKVDGYPNVIHGLGGGYLPYVDTSNVRRDDCKNLKITAIRELHEESGVLSSNFVDNFICVIEEGHKQTNAFGYLTFFYINLLSKKSNFVSNHDNLQEGEIVSIEITHENIFSMIVHGSCKGHKVHPQLRAMLLIWLKTGCTGISLFRYWKIKPNKIFTSLIK